MLWKKVVSVLGVVALGGLAAQIFSAENLFSSLSAEEASFELQISGAYRDNSIINPHCLDGYKSWSKSNRRKMTGWDPTFIINTVNGNSNGIPSLNQFLDVNGDGLVDYVYAFSNNAYSYKNDPKVVFERDGFLLSEQGIRTNETCVYLNNGNGWDLSYRCKEEYDQRSVNGVFYFEPTYYGDCADI